MGIQARPPRGRIIETQVSITTGTDAPAPPQRLACAFVRKHGDGIMKPALRLAAVLAVSAGMATVCAQTNPRPLPRLVHKEGRYALFVDDAPYLMLGAQVGNSSAWPG